MKSERQGVREASIYFVVTGVAQAVAFLLFPIVTRFLAPDAYGAYSLVLAITGFLNTFGSVWVRNVGMRVFFDYVKTGETRSFFLTAAGLQAVVMAVALAIGYLALQALGFELSPPLYVWGSINVLVSDLYALILNTLRAERRAFTFGLAEIVSALLRLAGTAGALVVGYSSPTVLFVAATAAVAAGGVLVLPALWRRLSGPSYVNRACIRELVRLGIPSIPLSLGGWLISLSDRLLLEYFSTTSVVGLYSAAFGLADRAVGAVVGALFMAAWPAILSTWTQSSRETPARIGSYLRLFILLLTGPVWLLILERDFVLRLLTGPDYWGAAFLIPYAALGALLAGIATYLNRPLELNKHYARLSLITMVGAVANVVLNLILIPRSGALGAAQSTVIAYFVVMVLSRWYSQPLLHVPIPWASFVVALAAAALATGVWLLVPASFLGIAVFLLLYGLLVLLAPERVGGFGLRLGLIPRRSDR